MFTASSRRCPPASGNSGAVHFRQFSRARSRSGRHATLLSDAAADGACGESWEELVVYAVCVPRICAARGRSELPRLGGRTRSGSVLFANERSVLTPCELDVLKLVAQGLSNPTSPGGWC
jgi:DNA-binding NarL/FixJ family response regulator